MHAFILESLEDKCCALKVAHQNSLVYVQFQ